MKWELKYRGNIFGLYQAVLENGRVYEEVRRSPGVRLLIINKQNQILLNREKRRILNHAVDYRLPGGMVFDDIKDVEKYRHHPGVSDYVIQAAIREAIEEIGLKIREEDCKIYASDQADGKVEFDLYFVVVQERQVLKEGPIFADTEKDEIMGWAWHDFHEAMLLALDSVKFSEGRSARMLLSYLSSKK